MVIRLEELPINSENLEENVTLETKEEAGTIYRPAESSEESRK